MFESKPLKPAKIQETVVEMAKKMLEQYNNLSDTSI